MNESKNYNYSLKQKELYKFMFIDILKRWAENGEILKVFFL
jgi:predicted transglutaminase-like protease